MSHAALGMTRAADRHRQARVRSVFLTSLSLQNKPRRVMSETRKRSRRRFGGHAHKKQRGARELEVGAQGVLVTCNMNERKCTSEAFSLLSEYADALYGPEQVTSMFLVHYRV